MDVIVVRTFVITRRHDVVGGCWSVFPQCQWSWVLWRALSSLRGATREPVGPTVRRPPFPMNGLAESRTNLSDCGRARSYLCIRWYDERWPGDNERSNPALFGCVDLTWLGCSRVSLLLRHAQFSFFQHDVRPWCCLLVSLVSSCRPCVWHPIFQIGDSSLPHSM
jgi:hypothetical protein